MKIIKPLVLLILHFLACGLAQAACIDNVVLVHGNAGQPSDWNNTYNRLLNSGYTAAQIYRPNWGSKSCAVCNDHNGAEETPVRQAINYAIAQSCTGKIDIIGHSMGVTLAAQQIIEMDNSSNVDAFVGVAGAYRGLFTCGVYPFNVPTSTCGRYGLSVSNPLLDNLFGRTLAARVYSIKSWVDQVVCGSGSCLIYGVHSSQIAGEHQSFTFGYGHFGLQSFTDDKQVELIQ